MWFPIFYVDAKDEVLMLVQQDSYQAPIVHSWMVIVVLALVIPDLTQGSHQCELFASWPRKQHPEVECNSL